MKKRLTGILLCLIILLTSMGCSKNTENINKTEEKAGGYVENIIKISDNLQYIFNVVNLENGHLIVDGVDSEYNNKIFISKDNGESWNEKEINHLNFETPINAKCFTIMNNGNILVAYILGEMNEKTIQYGMINENGQVNAIDLDINQENTAEGFNTAPTNFSILNNGDLIYQTFDGTEIVQLDKETFKEKFRYPLEFYSDYISNIEEKLIITSISSIDVYDINTGELKNNLEELENEILNTDKNILPINVKTNENFYYYSSKGLSRYNLKKKETENLINDSKYLNNPNNSIDKLLELSHDTFLILISDPYTGIYNLIKYSYDPNYIKAEENDIVVYSLTENKKLRNKIALYESQNPNISIKYQVGVTNEDGLELSDALKTLNTEIMGGKGPDILLLDGLPADVFAENEILADMSDIVDEYQDELFTGILSPYKIDGEVYQLPMSISIPMIIGNKDVINKITDLESLLAVIKENATNSNNRIFEKLSSPEEFISSLYCIYENNWLTDKKINRKNLTEFMNIAKEIYTISKTKNDIFLKEEFGDMIDASEVSVNNSPNNNLCPKISIREVAYAKNEPLLAYGGIDNLYDVEILSNMLINKNYMDYKVLTKYNNNIFIPNDKIGINKNSKNQELSKSIVKSFLEQTISSDLYNN